MVSATSWPELADSDRGEGRSFETRDSARNPAPASAIARRDGAGPGNRDVLAQDEARASAGTRTEAVPLLHS